MAVSSPTRQSELDKTGQGRAGQEMIGQNRTTIQDRMG